MPNLPDEWYDRAIHGVNSFRLELNGDKLGDGRWSNHGISLVVNNGGYRIAAN